MSTEKRTILVVDDSEIAREMVRFILQKEGFEVVTVDSPFSFGSELNRARPDLVLVDANMPALQGDKLVSVAINNGLCHCPIVLYSDRPADELQILAQTSGADGYIQKSGDAQAFVRAIEDYIANASSRRRATGRGGADGPVSQRLGAPKLSESGVFPSAGPISTRLRTTKG